MDNQFVKGFLDEFEKTAFKLPLGKHELILGSIGAAAGLASALSDEANRYKLLKQVSAAVGKPEDAEKHLDVSIANTILKTVSGAVAGAAVARYGKKAKQALEKALDVAQKKLKKDIIPDIAAGSAERLIKSDVSFFRDAGEALAKGIRETSSGFTAGLEQQAVKASLGKRTGAHHSVVEGLANKMKEIFQG